LPRYDQAVPGAFHRDASGGLSFLFTVFALVQKPLAASTHHEEDRDEVEVAEGFWKQHNPEVDQMVQELRQEKLDLNKREAELRKLAAQLQAEREAINQVTQRVAQMQMEFDQNIVRVKDDEGANLKKLVKLYSAMSPEGVAAIFKEMDEQTVVKLMSLMKEEQVAGLLDSMAKEGDAQAKKAAAISEALRRLVGDKKKIP
jgi:flagellar motility protein MotE (MotC chaperone)